MWIGTITSSGADAPAFGVVLEERAELESPGEEGLLPKGTDRAGGGAVRAAGPE